MVRGLGFCRFMRVLNLKANRRYRSLLYVDADARMETYTDAEGNKRSNLSLIARTFPPPLPPRTRSLPPSQSSKDISTATLTQPQETSMSSRALAPKTLTPTMRVSSKKPPVKQGDKRRKINWARRSFPLYSRRSWSTQCWVCTMFYGLGCMISALKVG